MLVLSSFGSSQPIMALNHIKGQGGIGYSGSIDEVDSALGDTGGVRLEAELRRSQRLNDLAKSLDKVTTGD